MLTTLKDHLVEIPQTRHVMNKFVGSYEKGCQTSYCECAYTDREESYHEWGGSHVERVYDVLSEYNAICDAEPAR